MVQVVAQMVQRRFMHHACFLLRWWARTLGMSYRGNTGTRGTLGTISELGTNAEPLSAEQQRTHLCWYAGAAVPVSGVPSLGPGASVFFEGCGASVSAFCQRPK